MKYRINRKTGDRISEIGIGSSYMFGAGMAEAIRALRCAVEGGINYFDLAAGDGKTFPIYGEALHDVRKDIFFQIHFGADYSGGTYGWSLNLNTIKRSVEEQLRELRTDYIDYGFIHCQDGILDDADVDMLMFSVNPAYDYGHGEYANDCIGCGHCDNRCPFSVKQSERMQEIRSYMGLRTR